MENLMGKLIDNLRTAVVIAAVVVALPFAAAALFAGTLLSEVLSCFLAGWDERRRPL
jgi:hypothetical protein